MTVNLTKPETCVIWRSDTVGPKTTSIPGSASFNNGYELVIKTLGFGEKHTISPTFGTIDGKFFLQFIDNGGSIHLLSDGANNDWVIVCVCTNERTDSGHGTTHIAIGGGTADLYAATGDPPPGPIHSSITTNPIYIQLHSIFDQIGLPPTAQNKLIAYVYSECLPPPTGLAPAPAVDSIFDDQGLTWNLRSAYTALLPSADCGRDQNMRFETWWADCSGVAAGTAVHVSVNFVSAAFVPHLIVNGVYYGGDWDASPGVGAPRAFVTTPTDMLPTFPLPTTASECMVFIWIITTDRAVAPLQAKAITTYGNPSARAGNFFGGQQFFNLNQTGVGGLDIHTNSAGTALQTDSLGTNNINPAVNHGSPTFMRFSGAAPPKWRSIGGGQQPENNRTYVITDSTGVYFFGIAYEIGNLTGLTEPIWDTSYIGAYTVDNGIVWEYLGTSYSVAPVYLSLPKWDTPGVGGGFIPPSSIADSAGLYNFSISGFHPSPANAKTGLTEPIWNVSSMFAATTDGTVVWTYTGNAAPSQFVVPKMLVTMDVMNRK
jgi:hypothetical protein